MRRPTTLLMACVLVVAACGGDSALQSPTTTAAAATSTTPAPTTSTDAPTTTSTTVAATTSTVTTVAPTTTTTPPTTTTTTTTTTMTAPPAPVASGSGCTPGNVTDLPDGDWFGFVENLDVIGDGTIVFDLACHFEGAEADKAATEDAYAFMPLEFYPYIRNQNPRTFTIPMAAGATVDDFMLGTNPYVLWVPMIDPESGCSFATGYRACPLWVRIQGGEGVHLYGLLPEWAGDGRGS